MASSAGSQANCSSGKGDALCAGAKRPIVPAKRAFQTFERARQLRRIARLRIIEQNRLRGQRDERAQPHFYRRDNGRQRRQNFEGFGEGVIEGTAQLIGRAKRFFQHAARADGRNRRFAR